MDRIRMTMVTPAGPEGAKHRTSETSAVGASSLTERAGEHFRERGAWLSPPLSWHRAALGLFVLLGLVVIATFSDYGVTLDGGGHNWYGVFVFVYYFLLFPGGRCPH